jgi:hypothetical protein
MSAVEWRPLSERMGVPAATAWREEVPAALVGPLREWVDRTLRADGFGAPASVRAIAARVLLRLDLVLPEFEFVEDVPAPDDDELARGHLAHGTSVEVLPDVVDAVLYLMPVPFTAVVPTSEAGKPSVPLALMVAMASSDKAWADARRGLLTGLLDDARSVLRMQPGGRGLERRSDAAAEAAFTEAVRSAEGASAAGSAAEQLRTAWECVHALHPDPVKAYALAIKAVESAAHAVVDPRDAKSTMGKMLGQLRAHPGRFSLAIAGRDGRGDVAPLIGCMELLWEGQSSRHGSSAPTRDETLEEATMAVHLAVMLVQWFTSGAVRRS